MERGAFDRARHPAWAGLVGILLGAVLLLLQPAAVTLASGAVPVGSWLETQKIEAGDADEPGVLGNAAHWGVNFGAEIAVDGSTLVVGTQMNRHFDSGEPENDGFDWAYVFERDAAGEWTQAAKLVPEDAHQGDTFAYSLDVDETSGVIAAGNPQAEKVYVFERTPAGAWEQTVIVEDDRDDFGYDVAVGGETIVAGGVGAGLVFFERSTTGWEQTAVFEDAGVAVDLEGTTLVARSLPDYENFDVYDRIDGQWSVTDVLSVGGDGPESVPGAADLSPDGHTVVLASATSGGLWGEALQGTAFQVPAVGAAWVFELSDGSWVNTGQLDNPDPAPYEQFGDTVAAVNDTIVVGAPRDVANGGQSAGAAYVFERVGPAWLLTSKLRNSDASLGAGASYGGGDVFGTSVGISPGGIFVGAPMDDNRNDGSPPVLDDVGDVPPCLHRELVWGCDVGENAGSAYVFERAV